MRNIISTITLLCLTICFSCDEVKNNPLLKSFLKSDNNQTKSMILEEEMPIEALPILTDPTNTEVERIFEEERNNEEVIYTEILVEGKSSWDMNTVIWSNKETFYYSAWSGLGETRGLYKGKISWQDIVEGNSYKVYYSPRNWVENYETGGWSSGNFIIRIEPNE